MIPAHRDFTVEIKKLKFETAEGIRFPYTALVHFHLAEKDHPVVELMGHIPEEEVYKAIDRGEVLNLDHCYVEKFSLRDYRLTRNLDPAEVVVLKGFTARHALFAGLSALDFSHALMEGEVFSLEGAWISKGDTTFEAARFANKEVSFHHARLANGDVNFKNVLCECAQLNFKHCRFGVGEKDFQYMNAGYAEVQFVNTDFSDGNVNFINTNFGTGNVSFKVARFGSGRVDFHYAAFRGDSLSFERTEFGDGRVDFRTVEFGKGRVNFNRSVFGDGEVSFDEAGMEAGKFNFKRVRLGPGEFSFDEALFGQVDVSFERTQFGDGRLSFYRSRFLSLSLDFCHLNGYVDLRMSHCGSLKLSNTVVRDIIDLNPHDFRLEVGSISLAGMRLIGRIYLDWTRSRVKSMIYATKVSDRRVYAEQFRILKENFQQLGHYNDEDRAYVEFKRNESLADLRDSLDLSPWNGIWHYPLYLFKLILFDKAGLYATSPVRVLLTMLTSFVIFSLIYVFLILGSQADIIASVDDQLSVVSRAFYHSAITFLTIGYGDHFPFGSIRWVSSLEGFFGLFLMSYFTVAFVRKVLR
jgi:hypothetical protein